MLDRIPAENVAEPDIHCLACGHGYVHVGEGPHPGACPACGSRAVSLAGDVEIAATHKNDGDSPHTVIFIQAEDASDRCFRYVVSVDEGSEFAVVDQAYVDQYAWEAGVHQHFRELVPDCIEAAVEQMGYEYVPVKGPRHD